MLPDIINPLDGIIGRLAHGPMHRFAISSESEWRGVDVEMLMRRYGVRIWGREPDHDGEFALLVKRRQAVWAEYLLCRAGVPLIGELLDPRNEYYREDHAPGSMPKPWDAKGIGAHSMVDHVVDWLNQLLG